MAEKNDASYWLKFFTEAGIPKSDAHEYPLIFTENRIKKNMLLDLDRELLKELGVVILGDIIAIIKQAKKVGIIHCSIPSLGNLGVAAPS